MKYRLQNSKRLFTSYIAAEVWIGDTKWTVARPINKIKADHAYKSATIEQALTGEVTPQTYKHDFLSALNQATTGRLKVTAFNQNRGITWNHLMEALSRDQEAHLAALHLWRSAAANSDPLKTSDSDRCLIMRCLFGLADGGESTLLNQRETPPMKTASRNATSPQAATPNHATWPSSESKSFRKSPISDRKNCSSLRFAKMRRKISTPSVKPSTPAS